MTRAGNLPPPPPNPPPTPTTQKPLVNIKNGGKIRVSYIPSNVSIIGEAVKPDDSISDEPVGINFLDHPSNESKSGVRVGVVKWMVRLIYGNKKKKKQQAQ